jgi:voltage-gated potassium channel
MARITIRGALSAAALFAFYYLMPIRAKSVMQDVLWLVAALGAFAGVIALQVRGIVNSRYPRLRAIESMAVSIPLFLIVFARIYLTLSATTLHPFSIELDRTRALYFTITVFSTVGFGDITPTTDFARLIVAAQMMLDLVVLGAIVRVLLGAAERGRANRAGE